MAENVFVPLESPETRFPLESKISKEKLVEEPAHAVAAASCKFWAELGTFTDTVRLVGLPDKTTSVFTSLTTTE